MKKLALLLALMPSVAFAASRPAKVVYDGKLGSVSYGKLPSRVSVVHEIPVTGSFIEGGMMALKGYKDVKLVSGQAKVETQSKVEVDLSLKSFTITPTTADASAKVKFVGNDVGGAKSKTVTIDWSLAAAPRAPVAQPAATQSVAK